MLPSSARASSSTNRSDQYDRKLQYVGSHDADCDMVVRGDLSQVDAPLVAFFLRAGRLAAVLSVNNGKDLRRAKQLIGHAVDPVALADRASTCGSWRRSQLPADSDRRPRGTSA